MRIPGLKTLRRTSRWLRSRLTGGTLILGYHRIAQVADDPYALCVSPDHFAEQLATLRHYANPLSLFDLIEGLAQRNLPKRAVVVTFDDGYVDALTAAKPLLEAYDIPATLFAVTGTLGKPFWWDVLHQTWLASTRRQPLMATYRQLRVLPPTERDAVLESLRAETGLQPDHDAYRTLTEPELMELASGGLVEIGSHTATHPLLPHLPLHEQRHELVTSKNDLEALLNRPVRFFSYPNGAWSVATQQVVRDVGMLAACGSFNDLARPGIDRFHLPRFWVPDQDGATFERWLKHWLAG